MIKGARKEMIVVRTGNNRYFDEAYFVLREDIQQKGQNNKDILNEANRILADLTPNFPCTHQTKNRQWIFFGIGGLCGALLSIIITLLIV